MKPMHAWLLVLALSPMTLLAQDEAAPEESAPEAAPADSGAVMDAVTEDATEGATEGATEETVGTVPVDTGEEVAAEPSTPWLLYVGVDQVRTTLSVSGLPPGTPSVFDSGIYRVRAGYHFTSEIATELQFGVKQSADQPNEVETESYYGLFLVPETNLFGYVDMTFPVGYAQNKLGGESFRSAAFGVDAELPLQMYMESLPDIRLTLGWMTYYQKRDARLYGANFGLRWDFGLGGPGGDAEPLSQ